MELKEAEVCTISYYKDNADGPEDRRIIPSYVPEHLVRAIDVGDLTPAEEEEMVKLFQEYKQYYHDYVIAAFNFETWIQHTQNRSIMPKWCSFKLSHIVDVT